MDAKAFVVEALGIERAAFFERLLEENNFESGFVWNALFIQTFGLRLIAEFLDSARTNSSPVAGPDNGKLLLTLSALAQQMTVQEVASGKTATALDTLSRSVRETRETVTTAMTAQRTHSMKSVPKRTFGAVISAIIVLAVLVSCISWSIAYKRGEAVASHNDAAYAHQNNAGWNRFVRRELGLK